VATKERGIPIMKNLRLHYEMLALQLLQCLLLADDLTATLEEMTEEAVRQNLPLLVRVLRGVNGTRSALTMYTVRNGWVRKQGRQRYVLTEVGITYLSTYYERGLIRPFVHQYAQQGGDDGFPD
jgi:hypothetical protein